MREVVGSSPTVSTNGNLKRNAFEVAEFNAFLQSDAAKIAFTQKMKLYTKHETLYGIDGYYCKAQR